MFCRLAQFLSGNIKHCKISDTRHMKQLDLPVEYIKCTYWTTISCHAFANFTASAHACVFARELHYRSSVLNTFTNLPAIRRAIATAHHPHMKVIPALKKKRRKNGYQGNSGYSEPAVWQRFTLTWFPKWSAVAREEGEVRLARYSSSLQCHCSDRKRHRDVLVDTLF